MVHLTKPVTPDDHTIGPEDAAVTLVEYGSYDCPHCHQALAITLELLKELHGDGHILRMVYRHFPHMSLHSPSQRAAEVAEAAGKQGRFWEMHEHLLHNTQALDDANLLAYSALLGLNVSQVAADLEQRTYRERVAQDLQDGVESGVRSTPTFFINGIRHDDGWDVDSLRSAIVAST